MIVIKSKFHHQSQFQLIATSIMDLPRPVIMFAAVSCYHFDSS